ncbi:MAG: DMT family transporter [Nitrospirota bacterium]
MNTNTTASLSILIAIFLWSSLGIVVRLSGVEIHDLIFYSLLVAIFLQGLLLTMKAYRKKVPAAGDFKYPLLIGFVSLLNMLAYYYAFQNTTIANAVLTHYTAPIVVAFLSPFFLGEIMTLRIVLTIALGTTGLLIMLNGFSFGSGHGPGILAGLLSGFAYAVIVILLRMYSPRFHPLMLCFLSNITMAALLLPFVSGTPLHGLWSILFMGIVHSTIAPVLYYRGLQHVPANKAAVLGYLEPVCAIILSIWFLRESPGLNTLTGGIIIIISGYIAITASTRNAKL